MELGITLSLIVLLFSFANAQEKTNHDQVVSIPLSTPYNQAEDFMARSTAGVGKKCKKFADCDFDGKGLFCVKDGDAYADTSGEKCGCGEDFKVTDIMQNVKMHYCKKEEKCRAKVGSPCNYLIGYKDGMHFIRCSPGLKCVGYVCTGTISDDAKCSASTFSQITFSGLFLAVILRFC